MAVLRHRGNTLYLFSSFAEREICKSIAGHAWDSQNKAWTYPFASLAAIQEKFPGIQLPETIDKYIEIKKASEIKMESTKLEGSEWYHPFLMKHQKVGVDISRIRPKYAFFYDTGTGKTIMALAIIKYRKKVTLVVCPKTIIRPAWIEDAKAFFPELTIVSLNTEGNKKALLRALNTPADIYIVNFETFKILYDTLPQLNIKRIIVDESSKMKDPSSQITKDLLNFGKMMEEVYILTGTPAPNNEDEYWAQIEMIAPGHLGRSFYAFRSYYFIKDPWNKYKYIINPDKKKELMDKIAEVAIYVSKDDCLDLPPYTFNIVEVDMTPEQRKIYKQMEKEQFALLDDVMVLTPNKLAAIMKLRQITSGFILDENKQPHFVSDSKLNTLKEELESIGKNQAIIWIQFHEEVNRIRAMIAKHWGPESVRALYGLTAKADGDVNREDDETVKDAVSREFKSGKVQFLLAHAKTAMYGLTYTNAHYAYYYSMSHSYEEYHQSRDRQHRYGQKNNITIKFLACNGTIDKAIYKAVQNKQSGSEEILNYVRMVKGGADYANG